MAEPRRPGRTLSGCIGVVLAGLALTAAGCLPAPPRQAWLQAGEPLVPVELIAPRPQPAIADRVTVERHARRLALRVRTIGCGALGTGSGFALSAHLVVTNAHVVHGATAVEVSTWDGRTLPARVAVVASGSDLALLTVEASLETAGGLATEDPSAGDRVVIGGYPQGGRQATSSGRMIGYATDLDLSRGAGILRLDTAVEPGNSGGPVLGEDGVVVGVVYAFDSHTGDALAIPVSRLRQLLRDRPVEPRATSRGCLR